MKKNILVFALLISCIGFLSAQKRFHIGLQSGIVFSNLATTSKFDAGTQWIITNATNGYIGYDVTPKLAFSVEPGYLNKNGDKYTLTYIQLPVLAEYAVLQPLKVTLGPEFNFLLNNPNKEFASPNISAQIGAYYEASSTFDIGAKFSRSVTKLYKKDFSVTDAQGTVLYQNANFYPYNIVIYTRYKF